MGAKRLIDIETLCATYSLKEWTVRSWCGARKIPHIKIGSKVLFDVDAIEDWVRGQAVHAEAPKTCGEVAVGQP
jgi:Helix-turn-helix domain